MDEKNTRMKMGTRREREHENEIAWINWKWTRRLCSSSNESDSNWHNHHQNHGVVCYPHSNSNSTTAATASHLANWIDRIKANIASLVCRVMSCGIHFPNKPIFKATTNILFPMMPICHCWAKYAWKYESMIIIMNRTKSQQTESS